MAESELEEGEACCYKEDHVDVDDKTTFDPDNLSYIVRIFLLFRFVFRVLIMMFLVYWLTV